MNTSRIISTMLTELGKLVLRSEDKPGTIQESAIKFIDLHPRSFSDAQTLVQELQTENKFEKLYLELCGEGNAGQEPCHLAFIPDLSKNKSSATGFLIHIFKGEQDILPLPIDQITIGPKQYHRILHAFKHDLKRSMNVLSVESWLYLLQRYGKWIPAASHLQHVSLYNYTRMKIALSSCLDEEQVDQCLQKMQSGEPMDMKHLAFFSARINGKEEMEYRFDPGWELNKLKGYLYYFQMLRENIVKRILNALDLPVCNCLIQNDDSFLLLVPSSAEQKLKEIRIEIEDFLIRHYRNALGFSSAFCPFDMETAKGKNLGGAIQSAWDRLAENDQKMFADTLQKSPERSSEIFGPVPSEEDEKLEKLYDSCEKLGDELTKARWISVEQAKEGLLETATHWKQMFEHFGTSLAFLPKKLEDETYNAIYRFGNTDFSCPGGIGFNFSDVIPYLVIEDFPVDIPYWSVINFQVDSNAVDSAEQSIANLFTRKDHLQDFFKTYLAALLREKKYRKYTYLVKLDNEQVCMVCSPQIALPLINQICKKFRQFTEDKYTLSAKVQVYDSKYPINQAIYEERKKFESRGTLRNKITIMDETVPWSFLESLLKSQEKLSTIAKLKGKKFLFPLWGIAEYCKFTKRDEKKDLVYWRHMVNYFFNRLGITDNLEKHLLEGERGPVYLSLSIQWNYLMSLEA